MQNKLIPPTRKKNPCDISVFKTISIVNYFQVFSNHFTWYGLISLMHITNAIDGNSYIPKRPLFTNLKSKWHQNIVSYHKMYIVSEKMIQFINCHALTAFYQHTFQQINWWRHYLAFKPKWHQSDVYKGMVSLETTLINKEILKDVKKYSYIAKGGSYNACDIIMISITVRTMNVLFFNALS